MHDRSSGDPLDGLVRLADAMTDGVVLTRLAPIEGSDPVVEYVNPAFDRLAADARDRVLAEWPAALYRHTCGADGWDVVTQALADGHSVGPRVSRVELTPGSSRWWEWQAAPVPDGVEGVARWFTTVRDVTARQRAEQTLRAESELLANVFNTSASAITVLDRSGRIIRANARAEEVLGLSPSALRTRRYDDPVWRHTTLDGAPFPEGEQPFTRVMTTGEPVYDVRHAIEWPDGARRILSINGAPMRGHTPGELLGAVFQVEDITARTQQERLNAAQREILHLASRVDVPLEEILSRVVERTEELLPGVRTTILHVRDGRLWSAAAPSMPAEYTARIEGLRAGPRAGSCGTAVWRRQRVVVRDVTTDPLWADFADLGRRYDFRACWSQPIVDGDGKVLATFALYRPASGEPGAFECSVIDAMVEILSVVIQSRRNAARFARIFEHSPNALLLVDGEGRIVLANERASEWFQYPLETLHGLSIEALVPTRYQAMHRASREAYLTEGQSRPMRGGGRLVAVRRDGGEFPVEVGLTPIRSGSEQLTLATVVDITTLQESLQRLDYLAHYDALTNLPNRRLFHERLTRTVARAERYQRRFALVFVDVDNFKDINDSLGHAEGDELLCEVANRLSDCLRASDTLARIGGDEFGILLDEMNRPEEAAAVTERLREAFAQPIVLNDHTVSATASLGISLYPQDGATSESLLRNADAAMYAAKADGRNTFHFYTERYTQDAYERMVMEHNLRHAVERQQLDLVFQPQWDMARHSITGVEALLRWRHPDLGEVSTGRVISLAEYSGLILPIGDWVLETACGHAARWFRRGLPFGRVAINVSVVQLQRPGLAERIGQVLAECGLPGSHLELEVTEGALMHRTEFVIRQLEEIRQLGVRLAIDDFGTGYSSLRYLRLLPVQKLKIDRSFVAEIPSSAADVAILETIIVMARGLGLDVIAEGVENGDQQAFLLNKRCHLAQGFLFGAPQSVRDFESRLGAVS
jgi:diguanylate cyclase (GGDEF)-like protein/PAS domain S-box-containing protein